MSYTPQIMKFSSAESFWGMIDALAEIKDAKSSLNLEKEKSAIKKAKHIYRQTLPKKKIVKRRLNKIML